MTLAEVIDEQFLSRYRALLDAEDAAFDHLEHACEDGDRVQFETDVAVWRSAWSASCPTCTASGWFSRPHWLSELRASDPPAT